MTKQETTETTSDAAEIRLNKYLALHLGVSRRRADDIIASGRVKINTAVATLGARLDPLSSKVLLDDKPISTETTIKLILLNKPVGFVCSQRQQGESKTIYELLPKEFLNLKTVGRLDKNSSGLILLTNDGDFAFRMTHPKFTKNKRYLVTLDKKLSSFHQEVINNGIELPDGISKLKLQPQQDEDDRKHWIVEMSEGRNRQIRRTFSSLDYEVIKLHRTNFGDYSLGDIKPGKFQTSTIQ